MAKNAYLIVSDLHESYKNLRGRVDYRAEIEYVKQKMILLAQDYQRRGYSVVLLLLGDVFHNSYNDVFNACTDNNFFTMWHTIFGEIFSVLGNHELTYYSSNPFYTLVSDIESGKVKHILNKVWTPVGKSGVIRVPDILEDGNVIFHFNHNSTYPDLIEDDASGIHIGLFHQELVSNEVIREMENTLGVGIFGNTVNLDSIGVLNNYKYCFFGHMHSVYGTYAMENGTTLCYLASLGRTKESEVNDNFLERNIPAIRVVDGEIEGVDDNKFQLLNREQCVKQSIVDKNHKDYEVLKEKQQVKQYTPLADDPILKVKDRLKENNTALTIFEDLLTESTDSIGTYLDAEINRLCTNIIF